jgi:hypothetical protein
VDAHARIGAHNTAGATLRRAGARFVHALSLASLLHRRRAPPDEDRLLSCTRDACCTAARYVKRGVFARAIHAPERTRAHTRTASLSLRAHTVGVFLAPRAAYPPTSLQRCHIDACKRCVRACCAARLASARMHQRAQQRNRVIRCTPRAPSLQRTAMRRCRAAAVDKYLLRRRI